MKHLFLIIIGMPLIFGCSQRNVDITELKFGENHFNSDSIFKTFPQKTLVYYNGKKFSGYAVEYYGNGQSMEKNGFKGGVLDGISERYYLNGSLKAKATLKDGFMVDKVEDYFVKGSL